MANNVFVYCEIEGTQVQEVSQELLTKGRNIQIHYSYQNLRFYF